MAKNEPKKGNICWDCKKSTGGCSWSGIDLDTKKPLFKPIPGWTAEPVRLQVGTNPKTHEGIFVDTYSITACPLFERDDFDRLTKQAFVSVSKDRKSLYLNMHAEKLLPPDTTTVSVVLHEWKQTIQITASNAIRDYRVQRNKNNQATVRLWLQSLISYLGENIPAKTRFPAKKIPNGFEFQYSLIGDLNEQEEEEED